MYQVNVKEIKALFRTIQSKSEAIEYFSKFSGKFYAFDYEAAAKDPTQAVLYKKAYIMGVSFSYDYNEAVYLPIKHRSENAEPKALEVALEFMRSYPSVAFNMPFEYGFTKYHYGFTPTVYTDAGVLAKVWDSNLPNGLKALILALYKYKMQTFEEVTNNRKDFSTVSVKEGFFYGGSDSLWTFRVVSDYEPKIKQDEGLAGILRIENQLIPIMCEMIYNGIRVDLDLLKEYDPIVLNRVKALEKELHRLIRDRCPDLVSDGIIPGTSVLNCNLNSPKQLMELFHRLGMHIESTGSAVLKELGDPVAEVLTEYRKEMKLYNTYIKAYYSHIQEDNIVHFGLHQIGAPTGRMAGVTPNLMAIPKIRS